MVFGNSGVLTKKEYQKVRYIDSMDEIVNKQIIDALNDYEASSDPDEKESINDEIDSLQSEHAKLYDEREEILGPWRDALRS